MIKKFIVILMIFVMLISTAVGFGGKDEKSRKALAESIDQLQVQIVTMTIQLSNLLKQLTGRDLTVIYS